MRANSNSSSRASLQPCSQAAVRPRTVQRWPRGPEVFQLREQLCGKQQVSSKPAGARGGGGGGGWGGEGGAGPIGPNNEQPPTRIFKTTFLGGSTQSQGSLNARQPLFYAASNLHGPTSHRDMDARRYLVDAALLRHSSNGPRPEHILLVKKSSTCNTRAL